MLSTDAHSGVVIGDDRDAREATMFESGLGEHGHFLQLVCGGVRAGLTRFLRGGVLSLIWPSN